MPTQPRTSARRLLLRRLLVDGAVTTQREMVDALARDGHRVTQTTVSRDLTALGARKDGDDRYRLPETGPDEANEMLAERLRQFVVEIQASANIVVLHTPPGSAHAVAVALDAVRGRGEWSHLLGTIAGDDTLLAVASNGRGGTHLKRRLERLMEVRR